MGSAAVATGALSLAQLAQAHAVGVDHGDVVGFAGQLRCQAAADLTGTGLFRQIPNAAHISRITSFDSPVQYADWRAINAQALITGAVSTDGAGRIVAKFRIYDVFSGQELGAGQQLVGTQDGWRRIANLHPWLPQPDAQR